MTKTFIRVLRPYYVTEPTLRVRTMFQAWQGGPLSIEMIASLTGLPVNRSLHNALVYLQQNGEIRRISRGVYAPIVRDVTKME